MNEGPLYPKNDSLADYNTYLTTIEGVDIYRGDVGSDTWVFLAWGDRNKDSSSLWSHTKYDFDATPSEAAKEYARGILALIR